MKSEKVIIAFDVDGTLYDCSSGIGEAFAHGIQQFVRDCDCIGAETPSTEKIMSLVGQPSNVFFKAVFPALKREECECASAYCVASLSDFVRSKRGVLYSGIPALLKSLKTKGYTLCVASNGNEKYLNSIIETYDLSSYFVSPIVVLDEKLIKTKSDIVYAYREMFGTAAVFIMVGDRLSDKKAAEDNSIPFVGCAYGHAGIEEIFSAEQIAYTPDDIERCIEKVLNTF